MNCVYLLRSLKDSKQYIGSTSRGCETRLAEHNKGLVKSTKSRRPFKLVSYQPCKTIVEAAVLEKKYKRSSGALRRAIAKGQFIIVDK